jgi:MFS family permease
MDGTDKDSPFELPFFNSEGERFLHNREDFTLKQAMRTRAYWILISLNVLWAMAITAITFHLIPLFAFQGLSKGVAIATFTSFALGGAGMQLIGGFLADRFRLNILLAISTIGFAVGLLFLIFLQSPWMGHAYAIIFGVSQGLFGVVLGTIWVRYYGREHLGKIRGTATTAIVLGSSIGPYLMGLTFDQTMSYSPSLSFFIICSGVMAIAVWFATPPRRLL